MTAMQDSSAALKAGNDRNQKVKCLLSICWHGLYSCGYRPFRSGESNVYDTKVGRMWNSMMRSGCVHKSLERIGRAAYDGRMARA